MTDEKIIRDVQIGDAARLAEIYSYYVRETAVSFEYDAPSAKEFECRIKNTIDNYPYLVCEIGGKVVGYAYAGRYSPRRAYDWTVTSSIYVDNDYRRQGIGSALYKALEDKLREQGIVNVLAGAAFCETEDEHLTHDSKEFHIRQGYSLVAHMKEVGRKFDRWYDLLWLQKKL